MLILSFLKLEVLVAKPGNGGLLLLLQAFDFIDLID
jgi:hypothetical protein